MSREQRSSIAIFVERAFAPREIFFYWADRFHYVRLTGGAQKTAAAATVLVVAWTLFATTSTILDKGVIASKEAEIAHRKLAYAGLERDLRQALDHRVRLNAKIADLDAQLSEERGNRLALRGQRDSLARQLGDLEQRLADLHGSEQHVIERLSEQAREGTDVVEKTIMMTGLDIDALIAEATDPGFVEADLEQTGLGQGGPYLPADAMTVDIAPAAELATAITSLDRQLDRWSILQEVVRSLPLTAPLDQFRISSAYGQRRDPMTGRKARHLGVDFVAPPGTAIHATAPGVVVSAGRHGRYGQMVEIDHGYGIRTRYAHLRKILVEEGQQVDHRKKIGLLGSSGRSTGPHVHYEVRHQGQAQNPIKYILAGKHLFKD